MSDLFRDGGNSSAGRGTSSVRTPRDIMAERRAREARRQEEADRLKEDENQHQQAMDAERRSAATAAAARAADDARIHQDLRASVPQRQRSSTQTAQQPPKVSAIPGHRRSQTAQPGLRQSSAPSPQQHSAPTESHPEEAPSRVNTSSFPHAFERWEQLSSHWEGLTSYWLHKIEANTEEIRRNVPGAAALSRQIQDLSAAGANLFHAVVELQRLRASSERKFQRWFFETRAEQERTQEAMAEMARQLQIERDAKEEAIANAGKDDSDRRQADRRFEEMRKELNISKAEAKRAWEDLGKMEADQLIWIGSLRRGLPTVIGGVQVVPMHASAGVSHQSSEHRPTTSEGHPPQQAQTQTQRMPQSAREQQYEEGEPSPTNTDPFTELDQGSQPLHHEPDVSSLQPYPPGSTPVSSSTARTAISPQHQRRALTPTGVASPHQQRRTLTPTGTSSSPRTRAFTSSPQASGVFLNQPEGSRPQTSSATEDQPELFYQQPPGKVYLHSSSSGPESVIPPVPDAPQNTQGLRSQPSYGSGSSEGTEYVIDEHGQVRHDDQGRPIVYHPNVNMTRGDTHSPDSYDMEADVAREREHAARYGIQPQTPATSAEAMASFVASAAGTPGGYSTVPPADYEGAGYGTDWEGLQTRHHHPTRLSDVLEEDERSRTTGE